MARSELLNSYGMFQPSGPNFLRSRMRALKKQSPHMRALYAYGFSQLSNSSLSKPRYDLRILFLRPFGGSMTAFTPFWRIVTGNLSLGIAVSHILNLEPLFSSMFSMIASRVGMNDGDKWQFYKHTQSYCSIASLILALAISPWPYPKDTAITL